MLTLPTKPSYEKKIIAGCLTKKEYLLLNAVVILTHFHALSVLLFMEVYATILSIS